MKKAIFFIFMCISSHFLFSQVLHSEYTPQIKNQNLEKITSLHSFLPKIDTLSYLYSLKSNPLIDKLDKNLKIQTSNPLSIMVIPSVHSQLGTDMSDNDNGLNMGIGAKAFINYENKIALSGSYRYHTYRLYHFEERFLDNRKVLYGRGIPHHKGYHDFTFYLNWHPNQYFNIESGFGKHFIGKGHRSLLLSDDGFNYPYLKFTTNIWHFQYTNLWVKLKHIQNDQLEHWRDFYDKYAAMHYLSWQISTQFKIGFFEAIVWEAENENEKRGFEINYLNPIIFYRPVEYDVGSPDNALIGFDADLHIPSHLFYFQLMIDEFKISEIKARNGWWANKQAFQLGWRYYNLLGVRNLHSLAEFNFIRPFTYSHKKASQNYGHYNQSLAHPLGANVMEGIFNISYNFDRWFFAFNNTISKFGRENEGENYGGDIFLSYDTRTKDYDNFIGQGEENILFNHQLQFAYLINSSINLNLFSRVTLRKHTISEVNSNHLFVEIGLTNILSGQGIKWKDY